MGITLANNAHTTLSADASSTDTTIYVEDIDSFPTLGVGDYFYLTLERTSGAMEIVKVTQINASSFTVVRGQEDTIPISFSIGSMAKLNMTVQNVTDLILTGGNVNDEAYGSSWNGDVTGVPSRNALYDKFESLSGANVVSDDIYTPGWNGVTDIAPSKNAVYDKISSLTQNNIANLTTTSSPTFAAVFVDNDLNAGAGLALTTPGGYITFASNDVVITHVTNGLEFTGGSNGYSFDADVTVPDDAYAAGWNGSLAVPTKNAVYDKLEAMSTAANALVSDTAYAGSWNGVTTIAPSKNAVYDKISSLAQANISGLTTADDVTFTNLSVLDTVSAAAGLVVGNVATTGVVIMDSPDIGGSPTIYWKRGGTTKWEATGSAADLWFLKNTTLGTDALSFAAANNAATFTGAVSVPDDAYAAGWDGSVEVPTKNAVYDKIQSLSSTYQPLDADLTSWAGVTRAAGFDTFAATPSSANLAALLTDETGSGALVFATSPTLVTPNLGVATATSIQAPPKISSETTGALTSASRNCIVQCSGGVTLPASGMSDGDSILIDPRGTARTITRPAAHTMYIANTDSATGTTGAHNVVTAVYHGSSKWTLQGSVT